jgi:aromatic ring-opening dioxygenase LigB subunit
MNVTETKTGGLVFAAIAPHGGDTIAEIAPDPEVMARTRMAMEELGRRCDAARPDTIVVLNPHGLIVQGAVSIGMTERAAGMLGDPPRSVSVLFDTDLELAKLIDEEADENKLPLVRLVGEKEKAKALLPLDWGALVPLWFVAQPLTPQPKVVILAPDRSLPRETLVRFGVSIARAAEASGKRVALIASCDQGHAHAEDGPYGFDPASAKHDLMMCEAIALEQLDTLLEWPEDFLEEAKVDAYWQTIMLLGALGHTPMHGELLSYEVPTYFGMIVAAYSPSEDAASG